jgi:hypothetical protein
MMKLDKLQKELNSVSETVGERSNEWEMQPTS